MFCFVFFLVKKLKISCTLNHTILFKFHQHVVQILIKNVWRNFRLPMSALATVAGRSFNGKFTAKIDFSIGYSILSLPMLTLEVLSLSIHYLISIWTTCWWNLNKIVWSGLLKIWAFWQKMVDHFWQSVDAILEDVSVTETVVDAKLLI